jgi:hypothetical protein
MIGVLLQPLSQLPQKSRDLGQRSCEGALPEATRTALGQQRASCGSRPHPLDNVLFCTVWMNANDYHRLLAIYDVL